MSRFIYSTGEMGDRGGTVVKVPDLATLEGSSCTDIMTCTRGCGYSF